MKSELEEMGVRIYFPSAVEIEVRKRQNCTQLITTPVGTSGALAHRRRSKSVLGIMEQGAHWWWKTALGRWMGARPDWLPYIYDLC